MSSYCKLKWHGTRIWQVRSETLKHQIIYFFTLCVLTLCQYIISNSLIYTLMNTHHFSSSYIVDICGVCIFCKQHSDAKRWIKKSKNFITFPYIYTLMPFQFGFLWRMYRLIHIFLLWDELQKSIKTFQKNCFCFASVLSLNGLWENMYHNANKFDDICA